MKSIAFITRVHPKRPNMLKVCIKSVKAQTSDDYIHILHRDDNTENGYGVSLANTSLRKVKSINARYVMVLDDDDMLIDPDFVEIFTGIIEGDVPEIVFFKGKIEGKGIYPRNKRWGKAPSFRLIAGFSFAVRKDIWINYIHEWKERGGGDFCFISACYENTKYHFWLDRIVAQTQKRSGKGLGENEHA